ncbi:hypothetical protein LCGC14_0209610 [marine sediment metagenome]|uniref:Uncharacterized protein n=1 Tax=marine sediment metagenome TaxID=412755 RepID=A0A0F9UGX3_9ZZZZ
MYKLSKRESPMDLYVRACDNLRRQEARIEVQSTKLETLKAAVEAQQHRVAVAERQHRRLTKQRWDREINLGFTKKET